MPNLTHSLSIKTLFSLFVRVFPPFHVIAVRLSKPSPLQDEIREESALGPTWWGELENACLYELITRAQKQKHTILWLDVTRSFFPLLCTYRMLRIKCSCLGFFCLRKEMSWLQCEEKQCRICCSGLPSHWHWAWFCLILQHYRDAYLTLEAASYKEK